MKSAKWRLALFAGLFAAWIGFLIYLAVTTRNPIVLSRPQFLASTMDVIAEVDKPESLQIRVREVHWPEGQKRRAGETLTVTNLADSEGWTGPGAYVIPLFSDGKGTFRVATPPRSPGFDPTRFKPRIYPATPEAVQQLEEIRKPTN